MSNYEQNEKFKDLVNFISTHTLDKGIKYKEKDALESDLSWNASLFFAKAIHLAEPKGREFTLKQFRQFKKDYEDRNEIKINTDTLFQRFWLRNILGKIKVAGTVSSACSRFNEISEFKQELQFLLIIFLKDKKVRVSFPKKTLIKSESNMKRKTI